MIQKSQQLFDSFKESVEKNVFGTKDDPQFCEICDANPATECWDDVFLCDRCFDKTVNRQEYLADLDIQNSVQEVGRR
mgnify:CR=1 FL=1